MGDARRLWLLVEPIHAVSYFAPRARAAADALGMRGFWMGYVAQRVAPLGAVGPAVATAAFHGFHPSRMERALPDAWQHTTPDDALAARREGATAALLEAFADAGLEPGGIDEAADLLWEAAVGVDPAGRVLTAANAVLPRPPDPVGRLWQATTTLREHRGDGHVAVLVARGITPVESHLIKEAAGEGVRLQDTRAWPDDDWSAGTERLRERGLLDDAGLTEAGVRLHREIEAATDEAAEQPWALLGPDRTARAAALLEPYAAAVVDTGLVPRANPIGLRLPA